MDSGERGLLGKYAGWRTQLDLFNRKSDHAIQICYTFNSKILSKTASFNFASAMKHGADALQDAPSGRQLGDKRLLSAEQEARVQKLIMDKTPDQLKPLLKPSF